MNGLLEKILKCVQNRNSIAQKPAILPISTLDQMDAFQNIDDNGYSDVVSVRLYVCEREREEVEEREHFNFFNIYKY